VIEQAFTKLDTMMSKQPATSIAAIASSPPPPTPTLESSKTLNPTEIVQPDRLSATSENKDIDIKYENDLVPKLKCSFILGTKSDIVEIGDDVVNLSTTHAIIEQHLVDTKSEFFLCHKTIVLIVLVIKRIV
jgi:hypothetical protein